MKAQAESRQTLVLGVYAREFPGAVSEELKSWHERARLRSARPHSLDRQGAFRVRSLPPGADSFVRAPAPRGQVRALARLSASWVPAGPAQSPEPAVRGPGSPRLGRTAPGRFLTALGSPWEDSHGGLQSLPAQERVPTYAGGGYPPGHLKHLPLMAPPRISQTGLYS